MPGDVRACAWGFPLVTSPRRCRAVPVAATTHLRPPAHPSCTTTQGDSMTGKRLWEITHPYYGPEGNYYSAQDTNQQFETVDELIDNVVGCDADMNHVYRWDWITPDPDDYEEDDEMPGEELRLFVIFQRKGFFSMWSAPVERTDECEAKVLEFLRSGRVAGALKLMWEPVL